MTTDARVAKLEAALDEVRRELGAQIAHLRDEVERLRAQRRHTMRQTHRCPSCGTRRVLHFTTVADMAQYGPVPMSLQKEWSMFRGLKNSIAKLEAFACPNCCLVEWYAPDVDEVKPDGEEIVELTATDDLPPGSDPYR